MPFRYTKPDGTVQDFTDEQLGAELGRLRAFQAKVASGDLITAPEGVDPARLAHFIPLVQALTDNPDEALKEIHRALVENGATTSTLSLGDSEELVGTQPTGTLPGAATPTPSPLDAQLAQQAKMIETLTARLDAEDSARSVLAQTRTSATAEGVDPSKVLAYIQEAGLPTDPATIAMATKVVSLEEKLEASARPTGLEALFGNEESDNNSSDLIAQILSGEGSLPSENDSLAAALAEMQDQ